MKQEDIIAEIREEHRRRCFAIKQRMRMFSAVAAFIRIGLGWRRDMPKEEAQKIKDKALAMVAGSIEAGRYAPMIEATKFAARPFNDEQKAAEKVMSKLVMQLPIYEKFCKPINGFGALGLAIIIGEAGDLSSYPSKSALWKRMSVAVMDGIRQGGLSKFAKPEEWVSHGYVRERRARLWTIGTSMIKKDNTYRDLYLARKQLEREKAEAAGLIVASADDIPVGSRKEYISLMHIHRRAQRYMEKQLLKHLWQAWRGTKSRDLPKAEHAA